ncbi:glycosyltransferase [Salinisphaera sp. RV14]|uniref:glycosyltransferase n=1 Tax=unclassified Salinisphaera TaxID=2649847 RepID=UPI003F879D24
MPNLRIALVHYWFVTDRGGEKVVNSLCKLFPDADVFTHVIDRERFGALNKAHYVRETFIARIPGARKHYQRLLPLMPLALEQLDLREYDLVISSESGPAKGVLTGPDTLHICYCHSPMRYLWDMYPDYREAAGRLTRAMMVPLTHYLRLWDRASADRVDHFIANSHFIRARIRKCYRRDAKVIHPPVDVGRFECVYEKGDYFLLLGQLTRYKRPDIAIEAFRARSSMRLLVVGEGDFRDELRRNAPGNVEFLGRVDDARVKELLESARALVFPGVEDFGIVPIEAMACGTPVLAYGRGGALETVIDGETGLLFSHQTPEFLMSALERLEQWEPTIDRAAIRAHALTFSEERFHHRMKEAVDGWLAQVHGGYSAGG